MNSNLQKKLFHFEAPPPKKTWEKIAEALNEEMSFAQRLYRYEETPPFASWKVIESSLQEPQTTAKVVPFITRYKAPLRYIAAASMIAVTLVIVNLSIRHTAAGSLASTSKREHPLQQALQKKNDQKFSDTPETTGPLTAVAPRINAGNHKGDFIAPKRTLAYIQPQTIFPVLSLRKTFIPKQVKEKTFFDQSSADDFMVYSDGDGDVMKLSKKLFSLVCCKDGDGSCKTRLQRLRQTLSASVASADFVGMIDMLRQLQ
ncbi:hypothetical protein [Flavisolibacter ginsenosidimutans]|uniref:Uncharacterized protein n=1 Tax=Flavisolibacter ginsenosidimutans TaxID=661481 RepID=A0A5B8UJ21_9BACT|nr:hypothetical protein [Flavisolibacter ginsenosidimutans]QEC56005.1 hypothetical protein FSB75_08905 [Flavisolibacter ginsenosidimutans]